MQNANWFRPLTIGDGVGVRHSPANEFASTDREVDLHRLQTEASLLRRRMVSAAIRTLFDYQRATSPWLMALTGTEGGFIVITATV